MPAGWANEVGVSERIAELRAAHVDTTPRTIIATLMRLAKASEDLATTAGLKEARAALLEARKLVLEVSDGRSWDR